MSYSQPATATARELRAIANFLAELLFHRGLIDRIGVLKLRAMQSEDAIDGFFAIARCPAVQIHDGTGHFVEVRPTSLLPYGMLQ